MYEKSFNAAVGAVKIWKCLEYWWILYEKCMVPVKISKSSIVMDLVLGFKTN
jgi:hypothetical protein